MQKILLKKTTCFFYKHIKTQGLGSDMLKATQNIGWKHAHNMLILCVKIINLNSTFYNICLFWSSCPEVFLQIGVPTKLPKSLKNTFEGVHLLVKLYGEGWGPATLLKMTEAKSERCQTSKMRFLVKLFNG